MPELFGTTFFNDANLVIYYRFEGNSNASKSSRNGTDTNITYQSGKFGQGAKFNGTTSDIVVTIDTALSGTTGTVIGWGNMSTAGAFDRLVMFSDTPANSSGTCGKVDILRSDTNVGTYTDGTAIAVDDLFAVFEEPAASGSSLVQLRICQNVSTLGWFHCAFTYDTGGNSYKTYFNGRLSFSASGTSVSAITFAAGNTLHFGSYNNTGAYWNGLVDDMAVFSRVLTNAEILTLYLSGAGRLTLLNAG